MRTSVKVWALACACLLSSVRARCQSVVYSLSYVETPASYHARFPNPMPFGRSIADNIAMLRKTRKTEIYSVSAKDGKRTLLFSDAGTNLEIGAKGSVSRDGRAYVIGTWREWSTTPTHGVNSVTSVYELSLDGTDHFRRVAAAHPYYSQPPILNPQSTEAAIEMGKTSISIYSVPQWSLVHHLDLSNTFRIHCPSIDCDQVNYGWLADGNRLWLQIVVNGDAEDIKRNHSGIYIVSQSGTDLGDIPPQLGTFHLAGYSRARSFDRDFLGELGDGSYVFQDFAAKAGEPISQFVVIFNPNSTLQKDWPLNDANLTLDRSFISPSGKYLAYIQRVTTPKYLTEAHLWVLDLETGVEKELLVVPPSNPASAHPDVVLNLLGWLKSN